LWRDARLVRDRIDRQAARKKSCQPRLGFRQSKGSPENSVILSFYP